MTANRRLVNKAGATIAFGSVAAGYSTLLSCVEGRVVNIVIFNALDGDCVISLDGGVTDHVSIPTNSNYNLNLGAAGGESGTISVKQGTDGTYTLGYVSCGVIRLN
jgi:hypothetical protein